MALGRMNPSLYICLLILLSFVKWGHLTSQEVLLLGHNCNCSIVSDFLGRGSSVEGGGSTEEPHHESSLVLNTPTLALDKPGMLGRSH